MSFDDEWMVDREYCMEIKDDNIQLKEEIKSLRKDIERTKTLFKRAINTEKEKYKLLECELIKWKNGTYQFTEFK